MTVMKQLTLVLSLLAILAGCSQAPPPVADTRDADARAIRELEAASMKGWETRNADQIAMLWAADGSVMLPNMPTMKGSDMKNTMKEMLADPNLSLKFDSTKVEVAKSGELAYSQGTYTMTMSDPKTKKVLTEKGKYVTVFAKQADGSWKGVADINNADAPAAPADAKK